MELRHPVAILAGLCTALTLLLLMQKLISGNGDGAARDDSNRVIEFVRLKHETVTQQKERVLPEKPRLKSPPARPEINLSNRTKPAAPALRFNSSPELAVDFSAGPYIGSMAPGELDREFMPLARTPPQYPYEAARRGIEGWVRVSFRVTTIGTVEDVVVLESEPAGVFDRAAVRAVYKWKFKPRIINGEAEAARAEQLIEFELNK